LEKFSDFIKKARNSEIAIIGSNRLKEGEYKKLDVVSTE
jgi:hypothetical protein